MGYDDDDELERMRARREKRRSAGDRDTFRSGYSGPKGSSGKSYKGQKTRGRRRMPEKKKRILIITAEILVLLVLVAGAGFWYLYQKTFGSFQKIEFNAAAVTNENLTDEQLAGMKGYMTIACFGVDSRMEHGKMNVGKGTNADVNMICNVNLETGEIKLVSVFRDTYLNISDKNSYNKINAAYALGGPEQAVKALNKNLGLNITQYATFNWKAVADAINILDGVDINLSESELSWINAFITETVKETGIPSTPLTHAGMVHMDGVQAVAYGRLRYGDTDYARTERQRIVLNKAFEKAKTASWSQLNNILVTVMPQLATNITLSDMIPLARNIKKYHIGDTAGFPSARGEASIGKVTDCVIPQTLDSNVVALHKFLFNEDDFKVPANVKQYSEHISQASGMYKEGKPIGHVPVDQGISADAHTRAMIKKQEEKAEAEAAEESRKAAKESSTESESSTEDSSAADSSTESGFNWDDHTWEYGDAPDYWPGETGSSPGSGKPGSTSPGGSHRPTSSGSGPGSETGYGPGSSATKPYGPQIGKPGENPGGGGDSHAAGPGKTPGSDGPGSVNPGSGTGAYQNTTQAPEYGPGGPSGPGGPGN